MVTLKVFNGEDFSKCSYSDKAFTHFSTYPISQTCLSSSDLNNSENLFRCESNREMYLSYILHYLEYIRHDCCRLIEISDSFIMSVMSISESIIRFECKMADARSLVFNMIVNDLYKLLGKFINICHPEDFSSSLLNGCIFLSDYLISKLALSVSDIVALVNSTLSACSKLISKFALEYENIIASNRCLSVNSMSS